MAATAVAVYCIAVGLLMTVWWAVELRAGALDRPDRRRAEIALHLAAEAVTAALLVAGGILVLAGGRTGVALVGLGALLYTVVASPGYFVARREPAPVVMFAVLSVLTVLAAVALVA